MSNDIRITDVVIHSIERKTNSASGNPRWTLHTNEGSFDTSPDCALGYGLENYTSARSGTFIIGNPANPTVTLLATPAHKVWALEYQGRTLR